MRWSGGGTAKSLGVGVVIALSLFHPLYPRIRRVWTVATVRPMRLVEHRVRRSRRQVFSCAKTRSPGGAESGVVPVVLLVGLGRFVVVGGAVCQDEDLPHVAAFDHAVCACGGQVVSASGQGPQESQGCAVGCGDDGAGSHAHVP